MAGYDNKSNVVLSDSKERVYSLEEGVEEIPLGLYLVKGDMMYVVLPCSQISTLLTSLRILIGELDQALDDAVDLATIRSEPIPPIRYDLS